jgi:hypothetical protein
MWPGGRSTAQHDTAHFGTTSRHSMSLLVLTHMGNSTWMAGTSCSSTAIGFTCWDGDCACPQLVCQLKLHGGRNQVVMRGHLHSNNTRIACIHQLPEVTLCIEACHSCTSATNPAVSPDVMSLCMCARAPYQSTHTSTAGITFTCEQSGPPIASTLVASPLTQPQRSAISYAAFNAV